MSLLIVEACPRGRRESRTLTLLNAFKRQYRGEHETLDLCEMGIMPYDGAMVARREALINAGRTDGPIFALARQFAAAQQILIAAPYWDLSFPSVLKVYVEHIFARTITFIYDERGPVGLCRARRLVFLTTSGSPIPPGLNFGGDYLKAVGRMLGIPEYHQVSAEGLDIDGADVKGIMDAACRRAARSARWASRSAGEAAELGE